MVLTVVSKDIYITYRNETWCEIVWYCEFHSSLERLGYERSFRGSVGIVSNASLGRGKIDTEWRRIRIPLQAFNYEKRGVNMGNIKELRLEFQSKGDLHIDNIVIVHHEHNYMKTKDKNSYGYLYFQLHYWSNKLEFVVKII